MTQKQKYLVNEAKQCLERARKWLEQAIYYSGEDMPEEDRKNTLDVLNKVCKTHDKL